MKKKRSYSSLNEHMLLDPDYFAKLQPEVERLMRENPAFSINEIGKSRHQHLGLGFAKCSQLLGVQS